MRGRIVEWFGVATRAWEYFWLEIIATIIQITHILVIALVGVAVFLGPLFLCAALIDLVLSFLGIKPSFYVLVMSPILLCGLVMAAVHEPLAKNLLIAQKKIAAAFKEWYSALREAKPWIMRERPSKP